MKQYIHEILCNLIFNYLNFYDKHKFQKINRYTNKIQIIDLWSIDRIKYEGISILHTLHIRDQLCSYMMTYLETYL